MAKFRLKINTYNLEKKFKRYYNSLRNQIYGPGGQEVVDLIILDIMSRTPTPEQEVELIMFGEGGETSLGTPHYDKKGNLRSYEVSGRVRFDRAPGMFLMEAVAFSSVNSVIKGKGFQIGNRKELEFLTRFTYTNATKGSKNKGPQTYIYTTPYGMFAAFEYGTEALGWGTIHPTHGTALVPTDSIRMQEIVKQIPAFRMYSGVSRDLIKTLIENQVRNIQF